MRVALGVEYDGSRYYGWQAQTGLLTVQHVLEKALSQIANEEITVVCAGRTDTGVHATNQVIHFDHNKPRNLRSWLYGVNSILPKDVCITWGKEMADTFHARYSAINRRYRYIIYNSYTRPALLRSNMTWQFRPLNHKLMAEAALCLLGEHDYSSFRSTECQANTAMRNIIQLQLSRHGNIVMLDITANSFLHHM